MFSDVRVLYYLILPSQSTGKWYTNLTVILVRSRSLELDQSRLIRADAKKQTMKIAQLHKFDKRKGKPSQALPLGLANRNAH